MPAWLLVFLGGGLGSLCRYGLARWPGNAAPFPWGTFLANALACLLLGVLLALATRQLLGPSSRILLMTGFCGGFSTFSTFSYEILALLRDGQYGAALLYAGGSMAAGLGAVWLGLWLVEE